MRRLIIKIYITWQSPDSDYGRAKLVDMYKCILTLFGLGGGGKMAP